MTNSAARRTSRNTSSISSIHSKPMTSQSAMMYVSLLSVFCIIQRSTAFSVPLPEQVVTSQLKYLQTSDIKTAYEQYFSEQSREGDGDDWKTFEEELQVDSFRPILGHSRASVLMVVYHTDDACSCLVRLVPKKADGRFPLQYWWGLSLEDDEQWKVDNVLPDFESMELDVREMEDDGEITLYLDEDGNIVDPDEDDDDDDEDGPWLSL
jgi:hypothetical protein